MLPVWMKWVWLGCGELWIVAGCLWAVKHPDRPGLPIGLVLVGGLCLGLGMWLDTTASGSWRMVAVAMGTIGLALAVIVTVIVLIGIGIP